MRPAPPRPPRPAHAHGAPAQRDRAPRSRWSVVIATRNRREALVETLALVPRAFEVIVVDNASDDGTADAVRAARPDAVVIASAKNLGPVAKTLALDLVSNPLVAALDDDCAPDPDTWDQMAGRFEADRDLLCAGWGVRVPAPAASAGIAGAQPGVVSPYEGWDCSALPRVFAGAGAAFRADALRAVGGWDRRLFMQAEEYDLVFRLCALVGTGRAAANFYDLRAVHRKSPLARAPERTLRLDARNNAILAGRWLPEPWSTLFAADWRDRYGALARLGGAPGAALDGGREAALLGPRGTDARARAPLGEPLFDTLFGLSRITGAMRALRDAGVRRVLLTPLGKNILMFHTGAVRAGLRVVAVADDRFADARAGAHSYRGAPILSVDGALGAADARFDAVVIADSAPIHAARAAERWRALTTAPVLAPDAIELASVTPAARPARPAA